MPEGSLNPDDDLPGHTTGARQAPVSLGLVLLAWLAMTVQELFLFLRGTPYGTPYVDQVGRYLPFAIVFGCVTKWAKAFEGLEATAQASTASWYTGTHAFSAAAFSSNLQSFSSSVGSTLSSSHSSGGSGFSGGSSGGGGGGGGGGSW